MILPQHKAVFVHIPKTAGQSIEDYFLNLMGRQRASDNHDLLLGLNPQTAGPKRLAHLTAQEFTDLGYLSAQDWTDHFSFAFVRNPWDRIVSFYRFRGFSSVTSFSRFVESYLPTYYENQQWFFRPQTDFIYTDKETLLCDFVGRMEQLEEDFNKVLTALKLPIGQLEHKNVSREQWWSGRTMRLYIKHPSLLLQFKANQNKQSYRQYYDPKSLAIVHKLYERDIELLNYKF